MFATIAKFNKDQETTGMAFEPMERLVETNATESRSVHIPSGAW
jgi:hypothetical protein